MDNEALMEMEEDIEDDDDEKDNVLEDIYQQVTTNDGEMYDAKTLEQQLSAISQGKDVVSDASSDDGSYHSSHSDAIYPYKYAVQKHTSYYGINGEEQEKKRDYKNWMREDILNWIMNLNDGLFIEYTECLQKNLKQQNVTGKDLNIVTMDDIDNWGMKNAEHKVELMTQIKGLIDTRK